MNIVLFGHKNSGKTSLGKALSLELNLFFIDIDREIENYYFQKKGHFLSFKEIFLENENYFREIEKKIILSLKFENSVVALGGGSLLDCETKEFIQEKKFLFYLKISEKTFLKRALLHPPIYCKDKPSLRKNFLEKTKIFESIKAYVIEPGPINSQTKKVKNVIQ